MSTPKGVNSKANVKKKLPWGMFFLRSHKDMALMLYPIISFLMT